MSDNSKQINYYTTLNFKYLNTQKSGDRAAALQNSREYHVPKRLV